MKDTATEAMKTPKCNNVDVDVFRARLEHDLFIYGCNAFNGPIDISQGNGFEMSGYIILPNDKYSSDINKLDPRLKINYVMFMTELECHTKLTNRLPAMFMFIDDVGFSIPNPTCFSEEFIKSCIQPEVTSEIKETLFWVIKDASSTDIQTLHYKVLSYSMCDNSILNLKKQCRELTNSIIQSIDIVYTKHKTIIEDGYKEYNSLMK